MANRTLVFVTGILLGVIAGAIVVYYTTGSGVKNIFVVNEKERKEAGQLTTATSTVPEMKKKEKPPARQEKTPQVKNTEENPNILPKVHEEQMVVIDPEDEIIVKKDELMRSLTIPVISAVQEEKDTLASSVAGVRQPGNENLTIEYWKSPINYRGYKMGKNKLVLFGLPDSDEVKAVRIDNQLFLRHREKVFRFQSTADFRPFETETDKSILEAVESL